jgi:phage terminase large subunit GpA-like protein
MTWQASYAVPPEAMARVFMAREALTVSQWAEKYRIIAAGTSSEPGNWRNDRVPYLREILDAISDPDVERIYVRAASQVGKSELLLNAAGYFAHHEPAPVLMVQSTEDAMRSFSKERVAPMFAASPALRGLLDESERSATNTVMLRQYAGGYLAGAWAGSASSLASRPIRVLLTDELDRWPVVTGDDGDPLAQALQRTVTFHNRKIVCVSTPLIENRSVIDRLYLSSDRRRFHVPCPRCGVYQGLDWANVVYKTDGVVMLDDVHYRCAECGGRIDEMEKTAMLAAGMWKPDAPGVEERGYWLSALYSPWLSWREMAAEWSKACADRDAHGKQEFKNLKLGVAWKELAERISIEQLDKQREEYGAQVPDGVVLITCGVDVQDDRFEAEVVGWGIGKESWGIEYIVIPGDTSQASMWHLLDQFLGRAWKRADGSARTIAGTFIDSGGHRTMECYHFVRDRGARFIFASKGLAGDGRAIVDKPTHTNQLKINLFPIGVDTAKDTVYSRLSIREKGPGFCHFPFGKGYDNQFFQGLVSEVRNVKTRRWEKIRPRNEPLDCRVLATALMEQALVTNPKLLELPPANPLPAVPAVRRRVLSRGIE